MDRKLCESFQNIHSRQAIVLTNECPKNAASCDIFVIQGYNLILNQALKQVISSVTNIPKN